MTNVIPLNLPARKPAVVCLDHRPEYEAIEAGAMLIIREMFRQICSGELSRDEARIATDTIDRMLMRAKGERT